MKTGLILAFAILITTTVSSQASRGSQMSAADVAYAIRAVGITEGKSPIAGQDLKDPKTFVMYVEDSITHSWPDHAATVNGVAAKIRAREGSIEEVVQELRALRGDPGSISTDYTPVVNFETFKDAAQIIFCAQPQSGLNAMLLAKSIQDIAKLNPNVNVYVVNKHIESKITDHNELVMLIGKIGLEGISSLPYPLPSHSFDLYRWILPQVLKAGSPISIIESENSSLAACMESFKVALGSVQYVYFSTNGKQGEEHKERLFPGRSDVQVITLKPSLDLEDTFYGKLYTDPLSLNLNFVLARLTELQRIALSLTDRE